MGADTARKRLTRAESKARTRALLLEAAARTFARKGFAGASVEDIAESAGFSIGALYSNFANKEELFLEVCATYNTERIGKAAKALENHQSGSDAIGAMGRVLVDAADRDGEFALLQAEFWLYAARNPRARDAISAQLAKPRAALEELVGRALAEGGRPGEATAPAVAVVVAALFEGLVRQRQIDPQRVPEDLFGHSLRWLFAGIDATGENAPARRTARDAKKAR